MNKYLPAVKRLEKELEKRGKQKYELLKAIDNEVIVALGRYDKVEDILAEMKIEHKVVPVVTSATKLYSSQILLVNCPGITIDPFAVRKFVSTGGWLVTTDWALSQIIHTGFPNTIYCNGKTEDDVVVIEPQQSSITNGMINKSQFWLEGGSELIRVDDERRVKTLITSEEMRERYNAGVIMVGFNWGKGKVFHSISHFILQKSKSGETRMQDAYSSLVLLTNILAQRKAKNVT